MRNDKGLVLAELLTAIAILFIISTVIYSVFFSFNKNYQQITDKNSIDQTANLILATIKHYHQEYNQYIIKYDDVNKDAYIGVASADDLLDDGYLVDLELGYTEPQSFTGSMLIDSSNPLAIHLKLTNAAGQSYEIETIIKRY